MKKITAVILALVLSLTMLAGCKPDESKAPEKTPTSIKITESVKEFKNADGKVVYKVNYSVPELTADFCEAHVADAINRYITEFYLDTAFSFAENNVKNIRPDEKEAREINVTHEIKYFSDNVMSVVFSTAYSKSGSIVEARNFNLKDGSVISIEQYFLLAKSEVREKLIAQLQADAKTGLLDTELTEDQLKVIETKFDPYNFWFDSLTVNFLYNKTDINPGLGLTAGVYELVIDPGTAITLNINADPEYIFAE
ncbi:MAG: hypothetical protein IKB88_07750 [Clostridia bacterium]|nr:hypothetical protein [Clostridia bacterium]